MRVLVTLEQEELNEAARRHPKEGHAGALRAVISQGLQGPAGARRRTRTRRKKAGTRDELLAGLLHDLEGIGEPEEVAELFRLLRGALGRCPARELLDALRVALYEGDYGQALTLEERRLWLDGYHREEGSSALRDMAE